jgi:hypothetical protein
MKTFEEYNKEIRNNIIDHWTRDGHSVKDMENDPVINLLLSALTYQAYHIHRSNILSEEKNIQELRDRIIPFHLIKPTPAFSIIEASLIPGCERKMADENSSFEFQNIKKQKFNFYPLFNTKLLNAKLNIGSPVDHLTWKIELQSTAPIDNLSGVSFFFDTQEAAEIESIQYNGMHLPLIKPSQFNELPFTKWFNNAHLFINQNYYLFGTYDYWQELFLTYYAPLYYIGEYDTEKIPASGTRIELEITLKAPVDLEALKINCIPVVNVDKKNMILDDRNPVKDLTSDTGEFLNLLCDKENDTDIESIFIRQHGVERYNLAQLFEQMQEMLYRYNTDYYAFQDIKELRSNDKLDYLQSIMDDMKNIVYKAEEKMIKDHYYVVLKKNDKGARKVEFNYLTTLGAAANGIKKGEVASKASAHIDFNKTKMLFETRGGANGVKDETQKKDIAKYYFQTKDRLITHADICLFIKTFYYEGGKLGKEIGNIMITHETDHIEINILLRNDSALKYSDKLISLSSILQTKISLRSSGILPFHVQIS